MPRRAIFSILIATAGTLAAPAAPLSTGVRNVKFQPGRTTPPAVLRPAEATVMRPVAVSVSVKRPTVSRPSTVAVSPAQVPSAP
jgi:hypothetical protein